MSNSTHVPRTGTSRSTRVVAIVAATLALAVAVPSVAAGHTDRMPGNGCGVSGC